LWERLDGLLQEGKGRELPKEEFKREAERYLTGKETEFRELLSFKV